MSSIVPYAANMAAPYVTGAIGYKRARTAYKVGSYAYKNRKAAVSAARLIGSAYKRYRNRKISPNSKELIGKTPGTSTAKRTIVEQVANADKSSKTLYSVHLTELTHGDGTNINTRERNIVNFRGFKICMAVRNILDKPIAFHMAVVSPKDCQTTADLTTCFFRNPGATNRGVDFSAANATAFNWMDYDCMPINQDRFVIHTHKKWMIDGKESSVEHNNNGNNFMKYDCWIRLNRQVQYDATGDTVPYQGATYLVYWATCYDEGFTAPLASTFRWTSRTISYFREPKP